MQSEDDDEEEDQLHSLISGLERPPSVEDIDKGGAAVVDAAVEQGGNSIDIRDLGVSL